MSSYLTNSNDADVGYRASGNNRWALVWFGITGCIVQNILTLRSLILVYFMTIDTNHGIVQKKESSASCFRNEFSLDS